MKTALICGISGQDGSLLAKFLLKKEYRVCGTSRDAELNDFINLKKLNILNQVELYSMIPEDYMSVINIVNKIRPNEIYILSGQSSVNLSFTQPILTFESIVKSMLNILEISRVIDFKIKIYSAGSSECFGDVGDISADELTLFNPKSPYAVAKSSSFWLVKSYRESYGIFAATGILFNHESSIRPGRFVIKKILDAAKNISNGSNEKLSLGRLDIIRDWGLAVEYVEAMWLILQQDIPSDFVIATGRSHSLAELVEKIFNYYNLDWKKYVLIDDKYLRPSEIMISRANPKKAKEILNWESKTEIDDFIKIIISAMDLN